MESRKSPADKLAWVDANSETLDSLRVSPGIYVVHTSKRMSDTGSHIECRLLVSKLYMNRKYLEGWDVLHFCSLGSTSSGLCILLLPLQSQNTLGPVPPFEELHNLL